MRLPTLGSSIPIDLKIIETRYVTRITIQEANAATALETICRFTVSPKWLIHLPPTMSPPESSRHPDFLEHPQEVFQYFQKNGVRHLICEEKHMGSRAIVIVCKNPEVAVTRFGLSQPSLGMVTTRTGRPFFDDSKTQIDFLTMLHRALTESHFWNEFQTEFVCLDGELMPWSAKAKELLIKQYAPVGVAATQGLSATINSLTLAERRGINLDVTKKSFQNRAGKIEKYIDAYRQYCRETNGLEGLVYAPFHILATEGKTYFEKEHTWHLEKIKNFCNTSPKHLTG